jgi:dipeptidyl aminopeptidase/acylaminoacyl peptidase
MERCTSDIAACGSIILPPGSSVACLFGLLAAGEELRAGTTSLGAVGAADASDRSRLEALLSIPFVLTSRISTRRDRIAFLTNSTGRFELYTMSTSDPSPTQLTYGELPRSPLTSLAWSPDDREIALGLDKEGDERHDLFRIRLGAPGLERLTQDRTCQRHVFEYSPDGRWLLFGSDKPVNGGAPQIDLWRLPLDGGPSERITHHKQPVFPWYTRAMFRPDGRSIVYAASDSEDPRDLGIFVSHSDGADAELLHSTKPGSRDVPGAWSPDGRMVAFHTDAFDRLRTGILDVASREPRWLEEGPFDEVPVEFSRDGRSLLTMRTTGVRVHPVVHDLQSSRASVSPGHMSYTGETGFIGEGSEVLTLENASDRPNRFTHWRPGAGVSRPVWVPPLGKVSANSLVVGTPVRYASFDGREIEALLFVPSGAGEASRHPGIVEVHGGPSWQWFDEYSASTQFLVSQGFVVLQPNIRGSIGYGAAFRDLNLKDLGGGDLRDLEAAARFLSDLPSVDARRIGVTGISYGGYLTYLAMAKQPQIWSAGCAEAGITDWIKGYELQLPALQHLDRMLLGDPVENAALWADRSPVNFAAQVRSPLLMIHGTNDPRCPVLHARLFRDALVAAGRREGEDFEYLEYSDEGHSSFDIEQHMRSTLPMVEFFRRRLLVGPAAGAG